MPDVTAIMLTGVALAAILTGVIAVVPVLRRAFGAIPLSLLIGIHALRLGGIVLVVLASARVLSGAFPYVAGAGDFVAGAWAVPLAWRAAHGADVRKPAILAWNVFGTADLIVAAGLAAGNASLLQIVQTAGGSPLPLIVLAVLSLLFLAHAAIFARAVSGRHVSLLSPANG